MIDTMMLRTLDQDRIELERLSAEDQPTLSRWSNKTLEELTYMPGGLIERLIDWIVSSSPRPSRVLALAAVVAFLGALAGRRFASPTDLRTNFYVVALAPSGFGKDHARAQLKRLITAAGLDSFSGPSRFMSASALRNALMDKPSLFCMIDEFGGMMRQITDRKAGLHNSLIKNDMLELFSSASTYFEGAEYAGSKAQRIYNPNLCVCGTSTQDDFWPALGSLNMSDGLLPRLLLCAIDGPKPPRVKPDSSVSDIPADLVEACQSLVSLGRGRGTFGHVLGNSGAEECTAMTVQFSAEAESVLADHNDYIEGQEESADSRSLPFLNRTAEHAIKLALLAAISENPTAPVISGENMEWGADLACHSAFDMIREARDKIADNEREAHVNRILALIKKAGKEGITGGVVADRFRNIDKRKRLEIIDDLTLSGRIKSEITFGTGGRPKHRLYYISDET